MSNASLIPTTTNVVVDQIGRTNHPEVTLAFEPYGNRVIGDQDPDHPGYRTLTLEAYYGRGEHTSDTTIFFEGDDGRKFVLCSGEQFRDRSLDSEIIDEFPALATLSDYAYVLGVKAPDGNGYVPIGLNVVLLTPEQNEKTIDSSVEKPDSESGYYDSHNISTTDGERIPMSTNLVTNGIDKGYAPTVRFSFEPYGNTRVGDPDPEKNGYQVVTATALDYNEYGDSTASTVYFESKDNTKFVMTDGENFQSSALQDVEGIGTLSLSDLGVVLGVESTEINTGTDYTYTSLDGTEYTVCGQNVVLFPAVGD